MNSPFGFNGRSNSLQCLMSVTGKQKLRLFMCFIMMMYDIISNYIYVASKDLYMLCYKIYFVNHVLLHILLNIHASIATVLAYDHSLTP